MIPRKMKNLVLALCVSVFLCGCEHETVMRAVYDIVPAPVEVALGDTSDYFRINPGTKIVYTGQEPEMERNARFLAEYVKDLTGMDLQITDKQKDNDVIILTVDLDGDNPESYTLDVNKDRIAVTGASAAGVFYGIQTLRKSMPEAGHHLVDMPSVRITDRPRFSYRGAHLDVARHFFPVDSVKAFVDMLAMHNINHFHWHISDDQGWRIEIKRYPELTTIGSVRKGTMVGTDFSSNDSISYGGYYTQDEARDIVAYAAERYITVVPEIDMPGHMQAALAAYPHLGCTGGPYEVWTLWGISEEVLCAGNDSVLTFIDGVLEELVEIFPSDMIHIGGDECPKVRWEKCAKCQARIRSAGLKDDAGSSAEQKLQTMIMNHAAATLARHGRKAVGWDEILDSGLDRNAVIMSWRGLDGAVKAVRAGHDAILSPTQYCYFDYLQAPDSITDETKLPYHTYLPIEKVYSLEPVDSTLSAEEAAHILGCQANLWVEYIPGLHYAQYKELPRLAAMCEVQWSNPSHRDFDDFSRRLQHLIGLYQAQGYNYFKSKE